jgi:hypothetical protein
VVEDQTASSMLPIACHLMSPVACPLLLREHLLSDRGYLLMAPLPENETDPFWTPSSNSSSESYVITALPPSGGISHERVEEEDPGGSVRPDTGRYRETPPIVYCIHLRKSRTSCESCRESTGAVTILSQMLEILSLCKLNCKRFFAW